jgi:hypothetical protein
MPSLDELLRFAADEPDWTRVVHRCAWCGRVATGGGRWVMRPLDLSAVTTDGMCPPCGRRNLAQVSRRQLRRARPAA